MDPSITTPPSQGVSSTTNPVSSAKAEGKKRVEDSEEDNNFEEDVEYQDDEERRKVEFALGEETPIPTSESISQQRRRRQSGFHPGGSAASLGAEDLADAFHSLSAVLTNMQSSDPNKRKIKEPETFDGSNPSKVRAFRAQCELYWSNNPTQFASTRSRTLFILSYLRGPAFTLFEAKIINGNIDDLDDTLFGKLQLYFGHSDPEELAEKKLSELSMKNSHHVIKYITDYTTYASQVNWGERALLAAFRRGLAPRIKDALVFMDKINDLDDLIIAVTEHDRRYWDRQSEISKETKSSGSGSGATPANSSGQAKSNQRSKTPSGTSNPSTSSTPQKSSSSPAKKPEHLGSDGKLKADEKERRIKAGLCLYCGGSGHIRKDCPKAKSPPKARAANTDSADSKN